MKNLIFAGFTAIILFYVPVLFLPGDTIVSITREDALYETATAAFFLVASLGFLYLFFKAKNRSIFYLLFAIAFFFACGEEISWGQRILHFSTPAWLAAANAQKEFNLHNLSEIQHEDKLSFTLKSILNFNRLFILFYVVYGILVPLANRYSRLLKNLFAMIRLPIISIWFGLLFLVNEVTCKVVELLINGRIPDVTKIAEIKEALWAVILTLMAFYFIFVYQRRFSYQSQKRPMTNRVAVP